LRAARRGGSDAVPGGVRSSGVVGGGGVSVGAILPGDEAVRGGKSARISRAAAAWILARAGDPKPSSRKRLGGSEVWPFRKRRRNRGGAAKRQPRGDRGQVRPQVFRQ